MVTRRDLFVGSAAAVGVVGLGTAAAAQRSQPLTRTAAALPAGAVSGFRLPGGLTCPVPFMSRAAWGADESWRFINGAESWPTDHFPAQAITVHHTGFAADPDAATTVRAIYRQQALTTAQGGIKGWGDIGYNLLIDSDGVVYEGRYSGSSYPVFGPADRLITTAAHVLGYNTGNIGVCLLGYLDDAPATPAAQATLVTVLAYLAAVVGVNPTGTVYYLNPVPKSDGSHATATASGVSGHRNWAATDCPGNAFYPLLAQLRPQVAAAMPAAPPPPPPPTQPPTNPPASPDPTDSASPAVSGSPSQPPAGGGTHSASPPASTGTPRSEKGGDEYVAKARVTSPKEFPTVAPTAKPTPSPTPTATLDPSASASPSSFAQPIVTDAVVRAAAATKGPDWGVTGTVAGLAVVGALGGWMLRRRRMIAAGAGNGAPSIVDGPAVVPGADPLKEPGADPLKEPGADSLKEPGVEPAPEPSVGAGPANEPGPGGDADPAPNSAARADADPLAQSGGTGAATAVRPPAPDDPSVEP